MVTYFVCVVVFFFKQKTAYELRISDWSSDVCSSDLYAQRRAVLHQSHIVDVGDLRTADALVDPAHDIAQYALTIIVEFARDLCLAPVASRRDRDGEEARQRRHRLARNLPLPREHVDGVIVQRVQRLGGRRRHPRGDRKSTRLNSSP